MGPVHRGGTTGNLGLTWGWRTLSPRWRGAWGGETPNTLPLDYKTPLMEKVVGGDDRRQQPVPRPTMTGTVEQPVPASDFTAYGRIETLIGYSTGTAERTAARRAGRSSTPGWRRPAPR